jgi:hypothetical protein
MRHLQPPQDDHPGTTLRWVRRIQAVMVPGGALVAALLYAEGLGAWWIGFAISALALVSLATIGPAIRRADAHGPNDPATRPERRRRAERLTLATFGAFMAVALPVAWIAEGPGLAITLAVLMGIGAVLGIWLFRRWARDS